MSNPLDGSSRRKICVVITSRASYSRIRSALHAMDRHELLDLELVVAASAVLSRYGSAQKYIRQDGFEITAEILNVIEGENLVTSAKSTGLALVELSTVFNNMRPDLVVTIADRFETMATAIAAAYMNIPLVHVQGGEVTGSIDEKVRHAVTKLADVHLVASQPAASRVIRMGEDPAKVFVTGCPAVDLAAQILENPELNFDPIQRVGGVGSPLDLSKGYLVVLQHPVTTQYDAARDQIMETLYAIKPSGVPTIWFWPNVDAGSDRVSNGIRTFRELEKPSNIHFFKHMDSLDFLKLAYNSYCIVGNSSVAIRECAYLGIPAVNIGDRQNGRDRGVNVVDAPHQREAIARAIKQQIHHGHYDQDYLYGTGHAGTRIANLLATVSLSIEKRLTYESEKLIVNSVKQLNKSIPKAA